MERNQRYLYRKLLEDFGSETMVDKLLVEQLAYFIIQQKKAATIDQYIQMSDRIFEISKELRK